MPHAVLTDITASVTELRRNPMETLAAGQGAPVAILNRNEPAFYCVPADIYEEMIEIVEDMELNRIADARAQEEARPVTLDEL
ncbi:plasmid stabilization protein [Rhodobacteraceae bacterium 63075]|nr:plasmid stabilization protein [Rhodobacteraceae bacterium 63075]